ncbi:MAG: FAD-dependent oxidoreductase [Vulcanimicrobiota bacterium]
MEKTADIAVIGAGIAGLTCAYRLTRAGYSVDVYEREQSPGGRMRTRATGGMSFDLGANFLVASYSSLLELADELEVEYLNLSPVPHVFYRAGCWHSMNLATLRDLIRLDGLKLWDRLKLLEFYLSIHRKYPKLDFFDLSTVPDEFNRENAYDFALQAVGCGFADYLVDAFHSCMMFYRARETSVAAFLSLFQLKTAPGSNFCILHARHEMQQLPNALAERLNVKRGHAVEDLRRQGSGWQLRCGGEEKSYPYVVLATTAGAAREILQEGPSRHLDLLRATRYASTVNLAYRIRKEALGGTHCFYVPYVESQIVAEFTNEALKGEHLVQDGWSLLNAGLHESAALELDHLSDEELFQTVGKEVRRLMPSLEELEPFDLQRWSEAIPKYDVGHVARVKEFLGSGQGEDGLYLCGDYLNAPWLEGASRCGSRVAEALARQIQTSSPVSS